MKGALLALALIASPATAQQITTQCTQTGIWTNCNTNIPPPPPRVTTPDYSGLVNGLIALQRRNREIAAMRAQQEEAQEAANNQALWNAHLADLIRSGDCDEAGQMAIQAGRYDAANAVSQFCHQRAATPPLPPFPDAAPVKRAASILPLCNQAPRPDPCQPG